MSSATLRPELPPPPERIRALPLDHRGYPVPWFVAWIDGRADFRVVDAGKLEDAVTPDEAARVIALETTAQALERAGTPDAAAFARALAYEPGGLQPRQPAREADLHQITAAHDRSRKAGRRYRR